MKKKIVILGSTGSIGKSLLNIIKKNQSNFEINLLTARKNYKELIKQAKFFKVKNIIITDKKYFLLAKKKIKKKTINIYNDFNLLNKIVTKKVDYAMSAIIGLEGLIPTYKIIKHTKHIAIANKESIICGWNLINKELTKNKTKFIPIDSEHFSIWYALNNKTNKSIQKIYLTASGGPLLNIPNKNFNKLKIEKIIKHPNWSMGKKISVDSATMMNKVFEIIEAKKIFNLSYKKLSILIHPKSYLHAIIKFYDGMIKIIAHDTTMQIPIFNSLYKDIDKKYISKNLNLYNLNNLHLSNINSDKFPLINIIKKLPNNNSLFETAIVSANDELVNLFLKKKIKYTDIINTLLKIVNMNEIKKMKKISPQKISDIIKTNSYVRNKINNIFS